MDGLGKITYQDGTTYQGDWVNNHPNGEGKIIFSDGSTFEGTVTMGQPTDQGRFENLEYVYEG